VRRGPPLPEKLFSLIWKHIAVAKKGDYEAVFVFENAFDGEGHQSWFER
jgi:hypothetical protein